MTIRPLHTIPEYREVSALAELVTYLQLGSESFKAVVDENAEDSITWEAASSDGVIVSKQARLPRVIFVR